MIHSVTLDIISRHAAAIIIHDAATYAFTRHSSRYERLLRMAVI